NVDGEVLSTLIASADGTVLGTSTVSAAETVGGWPWQRRPLPIPDDQVLVAQAAAALSADDTGDVSEILGELGVDFVLVGPDAEGLENTVSVAQGLIRVGPTESGQLWRVDKPYSGRFLIRDGEGAVTSAKMDGTTAEGPAGEDGRTLIVADASAGITASVDGQQLPETDPDEESWASEFDLPASGGAVEISLNSPLYPVGVIAGWALGVLSLITAIPFGGSGDGAGMQQAAAPRRRQHEASAQHRDIRGDRRARSARGHDLVSHPADPGNPRPQPRTGAHAHRRHPGRVPRPAADRHGRRGHGRRIRRRFEGFDPGRLRFGADRCRRRLDLLCPTAGGRPRRIRRFRQRGRTGVRLRR